MKHWTIIFWTRQQLIYIILFDPSKAFDIVWTQGLMFKLHNLAIKGKLWQIIDDCHYNTASAVIVNQKTIQMVWCSSRGQTRWRFVDIFVPCFCQQAFRQTKTLQFNITKMRSGSQKRESYDSWRYFLHRHIPSKYSTHDGYNLRMCMQMALYIQRIKILRSKIPCQTQ